MAWQLTLDLILNLQTSHVMSSHLGTVDGVICPLQLNLAKGIFFATLKRRQENSVMLDINNAIKDARHLLSGLEEKITVIANTLNSYDCFRWPIRQADLVSCLSFQSYSDHLSFDKLKLRLIA